MSIEDYLLNIWIKVLPLLLKYRDQVDIYCITPFAINMLLFYIVFLTNWISLHYIFIPSSYKLECFAEI